MIAGGTARPRVDRGDLHAVLQPAAVELGRDRRDLAALDRRIAADRTLAALRRFRRRLGRKTSGAAAQVVAARRRRLSGRGVGRSELSGVALASGDTIWRGRCAAPGRGRGRSGDSAASAAMTVIAEAPGRRSGARRAPGAGSGAAIGWLSACASGLGIGRIEWLGGSARAPPASKPTSKPASASPSRTRRLNARPCRARNLRRRCPARPR